MAHSSRSGMRPSVSAPCPATAAGPVGLPLPRLRLPEAVVRHTHQCPRQVGGAMAWTEQHGDRFRVRYRHASRLVTDGTYDTADAACARVRHLDHLNRAVKLRLA